MSPAASNSDGDKAALEALVFEYLERLETEGEGVLETLCAAHSAQATRLRERIAVLRRTGLVGASDKESFPQSLGEFRLLACLGAGGMGVVYLAEQSSLGRRVALKLIRPEHLYFPGSRERFQREVEAVARLQHRSIASVYTVGDERGIPYFAMEYVQGLSLSDVVAAFHGRDPATLSGEDLRRLFVERKLAEAASLERFAAFSGPWTTIALSLVREVALAVDHAHERGVLHRDIKPSNVMLTASGRVALLDFGLASHTGAEKLTRTGSQLGSLPYMAPEQVNGEAALIDARTDVYAMGVLSYELLALRAPYFDPGSSERTRQLVLAGRAPSLRSLVRGLGRDVETTVATAMNVERGGRYESAAEFATDLANVLANRPIQARRSGPIAKSWKWTQRHPARATALVLAIGAPIGIAFQQNVANRRLSDVNTTVSQLNAKLQEALAASRDESRAKEVQRAKAQANFATAVDAVETLLDRTGSDRLRFVPQMESVRRDLLEEALRFYGVLHARGGDNEFLLDKSIMTRTQLGDVLLRLGLASEAEREFMTVIRDLEALPDLNDNGRQQIALALSFLGEARRMQSKPKEALELARDSASRFEALVEERRAAGKPDSRLAGELAIALSRVGELEFALGQTAKGEATHEQALALMRPMLAGPSQEPRIKLASAKTLGFLASVRSERGDIEGAIAKNKEAMELLDELHAAEPEDTGATLLLLSALGNLGDLYGESGKTELCRPLVERALALGEGLVADFPSTPRFRQNLSIVHVQAFFVEMSEGHTDVGRQHLERALELQRGLLRNEPTNTEYVGALCTTIGNLGALAIQAGDVDRGLAYFDESSVAIHRALDSNPESPEWLRFHLISVTNRASVLTDSGRFDEAAAAIGELTRHSSTEAALRAAQMSMRAAARSRAGDPAARMQAQAFEERALAALDLALARGLDDPSVFEPAEEFGPLLAEKAFADRVAQVRAKRESRKR